MSSFELLRALRSLRPAKVLVLGDLILDRYTYGNAERISQESPVIVLHADDQECRLGGAANVCNMLLGLNCTATAAGVVGSDAAGEELRAISESSGIDTSLIFTDPDRPTTLKERFVGRAGSRHPSQILRVDREKTDPLSPRLEQSFQKSIAARLDQYDIILVSDYAKGVCTPGLLQSIIPLAKEAGLPILVDPMRGHQYERYQGATMLKANRIETEMATGHKLKGPADASLAGRVMCENLGLDYVIITLDRDGMVLVERSGNSTHFPTHARSVYDITGAGDMVLAMLGACLGGGLDKSQSVRLSNVAAGLEVEKAGVAVIPMAEIETELQVDSMPGQRKIVSQNQIATLAHDLRLRGEKIVFTNGCFDLLHYGHVTNLTECARMGQSLIVGLNSDASVSRLKGPERPIISQEERAAMLSSLSCVDYVVIFDEDTPYNLISAIRPDVLVKGSQYRGEQVVGQDVVEAHGGEVRFVELVPGFSTTEIIRRVSDNQPIRRAA